MTLSILKNLEATFMALLDDVDKRQNIWAKLRKKLYKLNDEFKELLPTQLKKYDDITIYRTSHNL